MLVKLGAILLGLSLIAVTAGAVLIQQNGFLIVDVQDKVQDHHIFVPLPMFFVNAGIKAIPERHLAMFQNEIGPHSELLEAVTQELLKCPDGTFVEIQTDQEQVHVLKKGASLIVDVKSPEATVYVQIPISSTAKAFAQLSSRGEAFSN